MRLAGEEDIWKYEEIEIEIFLYTYKKYFKIIFNYS